jgi:hypothetical protein
MDGKCEQRVCIKFGVRLDTSATETLEMIREGLGEHSLSRTAVFFNGIHVSRPPECQLKMTNVQSEQAPAKRQKMLKNSKKQADRPVKTHAKY